MGVASYGEKNPPEVLFNNNKKGSQKVWDILQKQNSIPLEIPQSCSKNTFFKNSKIGFNDKKISSVKENKKLYNLVPMIPDLISFSNFFFYFFKH